MKIEIDTKLAWLLGSIEESILLNIIVEKVKNDFEKYLIEKIYEKSPAQMFNFYYILFDFKELNIYAHINKDLRTHYLSLIKKGWIYQPVVNVKEGESEYWYDCFLTHPAIEYFDLKKLQDECYEKKSMAKSIDQNPDV